MNEPRKAVNGVPLREPTTLADRMLYSAIKKLTEETGYGTLNIELQVKAGVVTMLRVRSEQTVQINA